MSFEPLPLKLTKAILMVHMAQARAQLIRSPYPTASSAIHLEPMDLLLIFLCSALVALKQGTTTKRDGSVRLASLYKTPQYNYIFWYIFLCIIYQETLLRGLLYWVIPLLNVSMGLSYETFCLTSKRVCLQMGSQAYLSVWIRTRSSVQTWKY